MVRKRASDDGDSQTSVKKLCSPGSIARSSADVDQNPVPVSQASTSSVAPRRRSGSILTTSAGRVLRVVLKNFMCHDHLRVTLNAQINFICGKNGSGKSAILTALVIGLGGRAIDANRGDLRNLIKSGCSSATIEITLSNVGFCAFKPDLYGDEITVVRTLSEASDNKVTSHFKMLNIAGKVVASLKNELNKMLISFGIKINNPVTVLNQDMARNFLKSSKPADLYKFFSWSTGLSDIERQLGENDIKSKKLEKDIEAKEKELEFSSKDVMEIKRKHDMKEECEELEEKIKVLKNELNWTKVALLREELKKKKKNADRLRENIAELQKKFQNSNSELELTERKKKLEEELAALNAEYNKNRSDLATAEGEFSLKKSELERLMVRKKKVDYQLSIDEGNLKKTMDELKNLSSLNKETAAKRVAMAKEKTDLQKTLQELKNVLTVNETHHSNLVEDKNKKAEILMAADHKVNNAVHQKNAISRVVNSLKSKENPLQIYGDWMPALVNKIKIANANGSFSTPPIGPLGPYIKVRDERFAGIIEKFIGFRMLSSFCCSTIQDANVLREIFASLNIRKEKEPSIITSKFLNKVHDVTKYEVKHGSCGSVYSALEFTNPVVANCIIDQLEIECILLVPSDKDAFPLVEVRENVPTNCKIILSNKNMFYPAPNYRSYSMEASNTATFLQVNKEKQMRDKMNELEIALVSEKQFRATQEEARGDLRDAERRVHEAEKEAMKIRRDIEQMQKKLFVLNHQDEPMEMNEMIITEDIEYRKGVMQKFKDELEEIKNRRKEIEEEISQTESVRSTLRSKTRSHSSKESALKSKLSEVADELQELKFNAKKFQKRCEDEEKKVAVLEKMIEQLSKDIEEQEMIAYNSGNTPNKFRNINDVEQDLMGTECHVREIRAILGDGDLGQLTEEYHNKLQKLSDVKNILELTRTSVQLWKEMHEEAKHNYVSVRNSVSLNVIHHMQVYLKLRNYKERMVISHDDRKIHLTVQMTSEGGNVKEKSVVCMSGGERSYSMVAFILALWQETEVPFYCLDEFDVFMDPVNRKLVINLLVAHARSRPSRQFVYLTPNDFHTQIEKDIGVFRLKDPRDDSM